MLAGLPYSEAFARPSPLLHLWSLSVEGQLYLLWPLLLVGVLATARRSTALLVTVLLAFASALLMALRYDPDGGSLAYYATDARASGFLVGAALAWVWRPPAWSRAAAARGPVGHRRRRDRGAGHARRGVRGGVGVRRQASTDRAGSCGSGCSPRW